MGSTPCSLKSDNPEISLQGFLFYHLQTQPVVLAAVLSQEWTPCYFQLRA